MGVAGLQQLQPHPEHFSCFTSAGWTGSRIIRLFGAMYESCLNPIDLASSLNQLLIPSGYHWGGGGKCELKRHYSLVGLFFLSLCELNCVEPGIPLHALEL
jgi:hypothetical protein